MIDSAGVSALSLENPSTREFGVAASPLDEEREG